MMLRKATSVVGGIGNKELCRCARTASSRSPKVAKSFTRFTSTIGSSAAPAPPLLLKLRNDMKSAMKNKDTERLNVLRSVIAETTNLAKTSSPIKTDIQLLSLLRKRAAASKAAASEFSAASREDLSEKELAQVNVLEEYASGVETVGEEEMTGTIQAVIGEMRTAGQAVNPGTVLKALFADGGPFDGKPVEKSTVAKLAKGMV